MLWSQASVLQPKRWAVSLQFSPDFGGQIYLVGDFFHRLYAGAVEVVVVLTGFDELMRLDVAFHLFPRWDEMVVTAIDLVRTPWTRRVWKKNAKVMQCSSVRKPTVWHIAQLQVVFVPNGMNGRTTHCCQYARLSILIVDEINDLDAQALMWFSTNMNYLVQSNRIKLCHYNCGLRPAKWVTYKTSLSRCMDLPIGWSEQKKNI